MILLDPPRWPAHGTVFGHLVSDSSLEELHDFAAAAGLPPRAFDHDHYDVPAHRYPDLVARGAVEVPSGELVRRLAASGLRVRSPHRTPKARAVLPGLRAGWAALGAGASDPGDWVALGEEVLRRWSEPHRHYHDVRHLAQCLGALDELALDELKAPDDVPRVLRLAAWFHDVVYEGVLSEGVAGEDEEASARLAEELLTGAGVAPGEVAEVARLVRVTAAHDPAPDDAAGALLVDADLSVLALPRARYHVYLRDVRLDYAHVPDAAFTAGRRAVVAGWLARVAAGATLYRTATGRRLWEDAARRNLAEELARAGLGGVDAATVGPCD